MSFVSTISSFAASVWFGLRRSVLRGRARRYRRLAMHDEVRVGKDLVITHQRRDLKFEGKVAAFNEKYKRRVPKGAVPITINLRKANFSDKEPRRTFTLFTMFFFNFKDTLTVQRGDRKVVVDRTAGLAVYGDMKAVLQEGRPDDFYRQTVLSVEASKVEAKRSARSSARSAVTETPVQQEVPVQPEVPETPVQPVIPETPDREQQPAETIILDPEAVAREHEIFMGNVDKIGKAIGAVAVDGPVEFDEYEMALVKYLLGREGYKASKQELQEQLTPYRKRLGSVLDGLNGKSCDITGEPLILQQEDGGDYEMDVQYYYIIFGDGR